MAAVGLAGYFFLPDKGPKTDWDNPDQVFHVEIPEDFNEAKIERVNDKIAAAKELYDKRDEDVWAWLSLGDLYDFVDDYERAIYVYEKAMEVSPYNIVSALNLASIYDDELEDYEKAEKYYKKAIEIHTNNPELYDRLARFYYQKKGDYGLAEKTYVEGLQAVGEHPDILVDIILFYEKVEKEEPQKLYAKRLLELYPDNPAYQQDFGHLVD